MMNTEYKEMTLKRLCRLRDDLEERLYALEQAEPDAYGKRKEMENLINNICELIRLKEELTNPNV